MLYDAKLLFADQEETLELESKVGSAGGEMDYSLLYVQSPSVHIFLYVFLSASSNLPRHQLESLPNLQMMLADRRGPLEDFRERFLRDS